MRIPLATFCILALGLSACSETPATVDLSQLAELNQTEQLVVIGYGRLIDGLPLPESDSVTPEWLAAFDSPKAGTVPDIFNNYPPNRKLMAKRAAELDALRRLKAKIAELRVNSEQSLGEYLTEANPEAIASQKLLTGAKTTGTLYRPTGIVEVRRELPMAQLISNLHDILEVTNSH